MQRPAFMKFVSGGSSRRHARRRCEHLRAKIRSRRPPPTTPSIGPADPKLRAVTLPNGKTMHLLPATLETTQWGWFNNAQEPVLRVKSGDTRRRSKR